MMDLKQMVTECPCTDIVIRAHEITVLLVASRINNRNLRFQTPPVDITEHLGEIDAVRKYHCPVKVFQMGQLKNVHFSLHMCILVGKRRIAQKQI